MMAFALLLATSAIPDFTTALIAPAAPPAAQTGTATASPPAKPPPLTLAAARDLRVGEVCIAPVIARQGTRRQEHREGKHALGWPRGVGYRGGCELRRASGRLAVGGVHVGAGRGGGA